DRQLTQRLTRFAQLVPSKSPAKEGDYITVNITSKHEGEVVEQDDERQIRIRPTLSFEDGEIAEFDKLMEGVSAGERRTATVTLSDDAENQELAGKTVEVEFEILEVKTLKLPDLDEDFLMEIGGFDFEEALREAVRMDLQRQLEYKQQQLVRQQITALLIESAEWDLPPQLLKRQSTRELERAVMELRRSGFSEMEIRARENELRRSSANSTARALKEH